VAELLKLHTDFEVNAMKGYISLKLGWRNVYYIHTQKRSLIIDFSRSQPTDFNDPEKRLKYVKGSMEHWNQHISNFTINSEDDIPYAVMLAKQVLKKYEQS
jgi:predicted transport protein